MECQRTRDLLIERQYGELQVGAEEGLTSHLERCKACRIEAASLEELVRTLDRWAEVDRDLIGIAVRVAVAQLPNEQRTVLILRHYQELAYAEIADALGIPLGTVKSRLHNALRALRTELLRKKVLEVG